MSNPAPSDELEAFRDEVRQFFREEFPQDLIAKTQRGQELTKADYVALERAIAARGWLAANWPREYGGTGWSVMERFIFDEELERAGAPAFLPMGLLYVAPVIYTFGTAEQKQRWLPDILSSRCFWAQGYSEPEAGSDLASVQMRAERRGDQYILNGTKIWTSHAQHADWIFCLVRTGQGPRKSDGISFVCCDLRSEGIEVASIKSIDSGRHLNSVTFRDVAVPVENRIGEEGKGWHYAKHLLEHERTSYAHVAGKRRQVDALKDWLNAKETVAACVDADGMLARRIAAIEIDLITLEYTALRSLAPLQSGAAPAVQSSIIKIMATETAQAISELCLDAAGPFSLPLIEDRRDEDWAAPFADFPPFAVRSATDYFFDRAQTIYGGSTEIQKTIIARQLF